MKEDQLIKKDMSIGEIIQKHPIAAQAMLSQGLHCIGCHIASWETLEQGVKAHGGDDKTVNSVVKEINKLIKEEKTLNKTVSITDKATEKLKEALQKNPSKTGLKIKVSQNPNEFTYDFILVQSPETNDKILNQKGIKIYIDENSLKNMKGAIIDFIETSGEFVFKVSNPNRFI